jgi:integrase/recombinase XerD
MTQLRVAVGDFLTYCTVERQLSLHTVQAYTADLADLRKWLGADLALPEISQLTLKAYLADMVGQRKLAVSTIRRRFACLRAFFRRSVEVGEVADPFANWRLQLPRRKRLPRTLTRSEVTSLLAPEQLDRPSQRRCEALLFLPLAIRLMVSTGMRVGELCKIRLEDVAPEGSSVRIHGKGSRDRVAYISDNALRHDLQAAVQGRQRAAQHSAPLFLNRHGRPLKPQSIRAKLRRYATNVGLARRITPHMLRHTAATLLIETGVDIRFVQRLLGHSSIATTEIYTHVTDEALRTTLARADVLAMLGDRQSH